MFQMKNPEYTLTCESHHSGACVIDGQNRYAHAYISDDGKDNGSGLEVISITFANGKRKSVMTVDHVFCVLAKK